MKKIKPIIVFCVALLLIALAAAGCSQMDTTQIYFHNALSVDKSEYKTELSTNGYYLKSRGNSIALIKTTPDGLSMTGHFDHPKKRAFGYLAYGKYFISAHEGTTGIELSFYDTESEEFTDSFSPVRTLSLFGNFLRSEIIDGKFYAATFADKKRATEELNYKSFYDSVYGQTAITQTSCDGYTERGVIIVVVDLENVLNDVAAVFASGIYPTQLLMDKSGVYTVFQRYNLGFASDNIEKNGYMIFKHLPGTLEYAGEIVTSDEAVSLHVYNSNIFLVGYKYLTAYKSDLRYAWEYKRGNEDYFQIKDDKCFLNLTNYIDLNKLDKITTAVGNLYSGSSVEYGYELLTKTLLFKFERSPSSEYNYSLTIKNSESSNVLASATLGFPGSVNRLEGSTGYDADAKLLYFIADTKGSDTDGQYLYVFKIEGNLIKRLKTIEFYCKDTKGSKLELAALQASSVHKEATYYDIMRNGYIDRYDNSFSLVERLDIRKLITITFDTDGGSEVAQLFKEVGDKLTTPEIQAIECFKEGFRLVRWEVTEGRNKLYNFKTDITLKAVWEADEETP